MTLVAEPEHFPRLPGQQVDVAIGSPIAVVALFTEIVRERFRPTNLLAWAWYEDPTPTEEDNSPTLPRKIVIEPAFNNSDLARNYRPSIYIDKGPTVPSKIAINNMAGKKLTTGLTGFYSISSIPIEIECVSTQKGESAILADTVWFYILAGIEQIRKTFGIHDIQEPVLGVTAPFAQDETVWSTKITTNIQIEFRWTTIPISPLLTSIVLKFKDSNDTTFDTFLLKEYLP